MYGASDFSQRELLFKHLSSITNNMLKTWIVLEVLIALHNLRKELVGL